MNDPQVQSQITFLYYPDLAPIAAFYQDVLGFERVEDQQWAKIYRTTAAGNAFIGIVDGERGFRRPLADSAVLITLAVDDVTAWYQKLTAHNVKILREPQVVDDIQIQCFFFEDPGGYAYEVQRFLKPELAELFHRA